jgi:hypothetical protein
VGTQPGEQVRQHRELVGDILVHRPVYLVEQCIAGHDDFKPLPRLQILEGQRGRIGVESGTEALFSVTAYGTPRGEEQATEVGGVALRVTAP